MVGLAVYSVGSRAIVGVGTRVGDEMGRLGVGSTIIVGRCVELLLPGVVGLVYFIVGGGDLVVVVVGCGLRLGF